MVKANNFLEKSKDQLERFKKIELKEGETMKLVEKALETLKVDTTAYHSKSFVGNHTQKMLQQNDKIDGPAILTKPIEKRPEEQKRIYSLLSLYSKIFRLANLARFMTEEEIAQLENYCKELGEKYLLEFPEVNMTIKMHLLVHHVPKFARQFRTVSMFSEQGLESSHAFINRLYRQFCVYRNKTRRLELVAKHHELLLSVKNREKFEAETLAHESTEIVTVNIM